MHPFIHLRVHSAYSLAEGAIPLKIITKLCLEKGMPAVAITDTHNLFGALEFAINCADQGIQPIIGCQINVTPLSITADETRKNLEQDKAKATPDTILLLCQSEEGYLNLLRLISDSYVNLDPQYPPQITFADLEKYHDGLLCLVGGKGSPLYRLLSQKNDDDALLTAKKYQALFNDRFYLELQRHYAQPSKDDQAYHLEEHQVEEGLLHLADTLNIPLVATNDVFFKDPSMHKAHDALLCIAEGRYISESDRRKVTAEHYFKSTAEMYALFSDIPEALENTVHIAKRCYFMPRPRKPILPSYESKDGRSEVEELRFQALEGLKVRLNGEVTKEYQDRLEFELSVIETMGFCGYFLIVADFIRYAKSKDIPVGPGRGSGAGSVVAWALTITDMDPLRFGLIFERFLNPERVSMPDFDIDFCQNRRDEVIDYVQEKYGRDRVAHIITFGKLQARAVLRDVGRVLQMPYGQVDKISKLVPNNPANPVTLEQALVMEPALEAARLEDESVQALLQMGIQLEGLYRHASKHAAGVVIGDRPLHELVPLYVDDPNGLPATQFNMKYVEMAGLVKFDFLGLKTLTVIDHCCHLLKKRGITVVPSDIPLDDPKTFQLLQRVETVGIFQLESGGMKEVVRKLRPDRFEDLIALVALFRPGPMDDIPRYVACKHGEEPVTYLHPLLEPILKDTYGVMVYQEQVMHIAQKLGGYSLGSADLLRRAMGKKIKSEMDAQRALFTEGAIKNGIKPEIASQIFDQMAKFAGYGFNKSHSAPYALLAYHTAYLKANYPHEFYAASMTLDMHNTDKLNVFRTDMTRLGVTLLAPDINASFPDFAVEDMMVPDVIAEDVMTKEPPQKAVRYGLAALKSVGHAAMEHLTNERTKNGPFLSIQDFAKRLDPKTINKRQLEQLIGAGCFDAMEPHRSFLWANVETIMRYATLQREQSQSLQKSLFGGTIKENPLDLQMAQAWGPLEKLSHEFQALSFFLSAHPLDIYTNLKKLGTTSSDQLPLLSDGYACKLVGVVITKNERTSKNGNKYAFVQLSDQHGVFEVALFSETYINARDYLVPGKALFLNATLRQDGESTRLLANNVTPLETIMENLSRRLRIVVDETLAVVDVETLLSTCAKGETHLIIQVRLEHSPYIEISLPESYSMTADIRSRLLAIQGVVTIEDV